MSTIRHILCATDLTPTSAAAAAEASLLGRVLGAEVLLLHVVAPFPIPTEGYFPPHLYHEWAEATQREAREGMDRVVREMADAGVKATIRIDEGAAAARILDVARETGTQLIVTGTHGRSGLQRALLGSVADRVLRLAHCPVLAARSGEGEPSRTPRQLRRICYATDFSAPARAAWPWVLTLAEAAAAEVELLHVALQPIPDRHMTPDTITRMAGLLQDEGRAAAERFVAQSSRRPARLEVTVVSGVPGDQIVHYARARSADLVVMGTHGWSGLLRWMLGSVATHVVQVAPCPVLTVSPGVGLEEPTAPSST